MSNIRQSTIVAIALLVTTAVSVISADFTIPNGAGIKITARNVTVDLGGHTITNLGTCVAVGAHGTFTGSSSIRE